MNRVGTHFEVFGETMKSKKSNATAASVRLFGALGLLACVLMAAGNVAAGDPLRKFKPASVGAFDERGVYHLSAEEKGFACDDLTGLMQVRLLDVRDYAARRRLTAGTFLQSVLTFIGLGSANGDLDARFAADKARLEAYNRRLAAIKCPVFNLAAELEPKDVAETPTPERPKAR